MMRDEGAKPPRIAAEVNSLTALIQLPCSAAFSMMRTAARSSLAAGAEPA